ncbi:MAG: SH3 domain-containing protein [bacterium]|nr:SH3 domain-containing protein [bacterium]
MNHKRFTGVLLLIIMGAMAVAAHAQTGECRDAAGGIIPCPTDVPAVFLDRDGDTVDDANDACPDVAGDPALRGCPAASTSATLTPAISVPLPAFPNSERCLIATFGEVVNIRQAPNIDAPIVGQLNPGDFLIVLNKALVSGELWYRTPLGYILASVVRANEPCDRTVPTVETIPAAFAVTLTDIMVSSFQTGGSAAPPLPDPFDCERYTVVDGSLVCLVTIDPVITTLPGGTEGAPPPDTSCFYQVLVDGSFICLIREAPALTALVPGGTEGAPPPDTSCFYQVLVDGSFICLIPNSPQFTTPVGSEAPPPPEPGTCYHLVIRDGQAYCLVTLPPVLTLDQGGSEAPPSPEPGTCYRLVFIDGQAVCLVSIPPVLALEPGSTEGAPPPDPFDCAYYVIYNGSAICLIPEAVSDLAVPGTDENTSTMPQTREHILLAFPGIVDPNACPTTTGLLLPAVQKVREAASRIGSSASVIQPLTVLPPADPCALEFILVNPSQEPTPTENGGLQFVADVVRVLPPVDPPAVPDGIAAPDEDGATEGAKCYAGSGIIGCTVSFGDYSFSAWYDVDTGGQTETCVPDGNGGITCS